MNPEQLDCREIGSIGVGSVSNRVRILAYLGELKQEEFVAVKKLIHDLDLRFTTAKNILSQLEQEWLVEKRITTRNGTAASFRIAPTAVTAKLIITSAGAGNGVAMNQSTQPRAELVPYVPPEWSASYGQHPYGT